MNHILVINSSLSGDASVSRLLVGDIVQRLIDINPQAHFTYRDVGQKPIPHLTPATVGGIRAIAQTKEELESRALSDELISELQAADLVVIGAPMYNFSIPSSLRTWFDHVLRPRVTFAYGTSGPEGLLKGKRAIVVESRGGLYSEGPSQIIDFQEPYLKQLLGFIGITDVSFILAEKMGSDTESRAAALVSARHQSERAIARLAHAQ